MIHKVATDEESMKQWRIITPILLMILAGIMTFTATVVTGYLGQINGSIVSISQDLKSFTKETASSIASLSVRVSVLEEKVKP